MLVPLSWLSDYVDIDLPVSEVDRILTNAGLEVKYVTMFGVPGADLVWDRELIVMGHVLQVEQHPEADRLVLASVDYGAEEVKVVVTGAPNLFPFVGKGNISRKNLFSPLALEGATLYDGHKEGQKKSKLKGRALRGIYNDAMLCSEKELGISEEHDGIILMTRDEWSPEYTPGTPLQDVLGDAVLEIDIIPNIARCASMVGVAREYAALTGQTLRYPDYNVLMEGEPLGERVVITTEAPGLNPRFVALVIEGVEQKPSPYWMQYRLRLAGQRPINVVVDISNYVMLEMGQPNHTFDYDYLRQRADEYGVDGPIRINTRLPHPGETLTTLDGIAHKLPEHGILVTDSLGNLSLGGIMGGLDSEIKPETKNVLLEAAAWNFINIRRTATKLGIATDAAFRFSRGVHPSQALLGAKRAAELMRRLAGGTVLNGIIDMVAEAAQEVAVELNPEYARQLSGLDLNGDQMALYLERLEFKVQPYGDHLMVTVPDHRMDIEGAHDLVEEICRMVGYDTIPSTIIADALPPQRGNPKLEREEQIRDILVQLGLQEVINYRLTAVEREARLIPKNSDVQADDRPYVTLTNPVTVERAVMRHSVLASVLEIVANNSRFQQQIALFEIGHIYLVSEEGVLPDELARLSIALSGPRYGDSWHEKKPAEKMDFYDLKGIVESLFAALHLDVQYEAAEHPTFRPGRTARILLGEAQLGVLGEIHPLVVERFGVRIDREQPLMAADLDLELILSAVEQDHKFQPISPYPAVREDLALVVDGHITAASVRDAIRQAGGFLLKEVELFDIYEGSQLSPGKKSLAYHLTFQAPNKTLTDKDVLKQRKRILMLLEQRLGAKLR